MFTLILSCLGNVRTILARQQELDDVLVRLAARLPFGREINRNTIDLHLPAILDNLEMLVDLPTPLPSVSSSGYGQALHALNGGTERSLVVRNAGQLLASSASTIDPALGIVATADDPPSFKKNCERRLDRLMRLKRIINRLSSQDRFSGVLRIDTAGLDLTQVGGHVTCDAIGLARKSDAFAHNAGP